MHPRLQSPQAYGALTREVLFAFKANRLKITLRLTANLKQ